MRKQLKHFGCRQASKADLQTITTILNLSALPSSDCAEHIENFIVIEDKDNIIGVGGLEICADFGLVRSIAVIPTYRGQGIAKEIYKRIESKAHALDIKALYLLTESAVEYFSKLGFNIQARSRVPVPIMETKQFKELCPSSATVMFAEF